MRALAVVFCQPAIRNLPNFTQRPEQIKIQHRCPVRPVKTFDKGILYRLIRFNNFCNIPSSSPHCASDISYGSLSISQHLLQLTVTDAVFTVPSYRPQNDVTLKMPAFEWIHGLLRQQKVMISLSSPTICNSTPM